MSLLALRWNLLLINFDLYIRSQHHFAALSEVGDGSCHNMTECLDNLQMIFYRKTTRRLVKHTICDWDLDQDIRRCPNDCHKRSWSGQAFNCEINVSPASFYSRARSTLILQSSTLANIIEWFYNWQQVYIRIRLLQPRKPSRIRTCFWGKLG